MAAQHQNEATRLLSQFQNGDQEAFALLYKLTSSHVRNFVHLRITSAENIDDVVQETYLIAWQACHTFQGRSTVLTWLCSIARFVVLRYLREQNRKSCSELSLNDLANLITCSSEVEVVCITRDMHELVARLPQAQQQAVQLVYFEHLPPARAARIAHCTVTQLHSRLYEARAQIRGWIG